jgi:hypothetical protein
MASSRVKQLEQELAKARLEEKAKDEKELQDLKTKYELALADYNETYGIKGKKTRTRKAKDANAPKSATKTLADDEILHFYEGLKELGTKDKEALKPYLEKGRRITLMKKAIEAWDRATSRDKANPEAFLKFYKG